MVPSGETPTAKSIAPPALFLRLQAPRNFAQSPAPTGLLLFRCLSSGRYSIATPKRPACLGHYAQIRAALMLACRERQSPSRRA